MCGEFTNDDQEEYVHEDYGEIMARRDECKTNEESDKEYAERHRVW